MLRQKVFYKPLFQRQSFIPFINQHDMIKRSLSYSPVIKKNQQKKESENNTTTTVELERITPQLDYNYLVNNVDTIKKNMQQRNYDCENIDQVKQLHEQQQQLQVQLNSYEEERDKVNQSIRQASNKQERQQFIDQAKQWKEHIKQTTDQLDKIQIDMEQHALLIPNKTHPKVPIGDESQATLLKIIGQPRTIEKEQHLKDHLTLAEQLDMIDFEQASFVTGSKWYYLKNYGAWLELALIQYAMSKAYEKGYQPMITPDVVRTSIAYGCGFQPRKSEASQIYDVSTQSTVNTTAPKLCLTGTAEIPLTGYFAKQLLNEEQLPHRVVGLGHAFRAEAGHGSANERGLYRVHQFSKVELFAVSTPDQSQALLEEFRQLQEDMFTDLGLCFRVLDMPTQELGASAYRKYDIEAWMPGKNDWGEISSTSNCTDYQTRRLDIRYLSNQFKENVGSKDVRVPWHIKEKWVHFCHTLNGTAMAIPRVIIAIMETHQQSDGSIAVPKVLRKWIPGEPSILK